MNGKTARMTFLVVYPVLAALLVSVVGSSARAQPQVLEEKALAAFKEAHYATAIEYLQQALAESPNDANIYFYLGAFTHFLCYDSVPLPGFNREKSDEILGYLRKAVQLDPHYGNAFYFIGAEYGARAREAMQRGDVAGAIDEFRKGHEAWGYPDWMMEYGRNTLRSCDQNAILFVGGDAEANPIEYLQGVEGYRRDVTVIPVALLDRPWFVKVLKHGLDAFVRPAPIDWSDEQIESMHPYKWKSSTLRVLAPDSLAGASGEKGSPFEWEVSPDLGSGHELNLLSAGRAAIADILLTNRWERPVFFSLACPLSAWRGLEHYAQLCGLAQRITPVEPAASVDVEKTRSLLQDKGTFKSLPTLRYSDMPRASGMLQNYRACFMRLTMYYAKAGDLDTARKVWKAMKTSVPEAILPVSENMATSVDALEHMLSGESGKKTK